MTETLKVKDSDESQWWKVSARYHYRPCTWLA
jgi:hypothetical protein